MLRVEKIKHAAFWENLWAKADPNLASIDSPERRIMLVYQLTVLLVKVVRSAYDFLWKFRASMRSTREDTRGTRSVLPIH